MPLDLSRLHLGCPYYPEHWPEARWADDARWMRGIGLTVTRMAEFAWALLEPSEDRFDFAWLDRAVDVFAAEGFQILLGTPTAAPPIWLSRRYPETLPIDDQGRRRNVGGRRHYCPNSPTYRTLSRRIARAMGERYGGRPEIVGWQIDNEFGGSGSARCYCEHCVTSFRTWLIERYSTLDALNTAWGTDFWSQHYADWSEIGAPILTNNAANPAQTLDYARFMSDSFVRFQRLQIEALREVVPAEHVFTTNFMGLFTQLDSFELAQDLDWASWDSYPTGNVFRWGAQTRNPGDLVPPYAFDVGDPIITGLAHDLTRGLKQAPFWVMEQQAGHINWESVNTLIRPGAIRLWTWHALAHGANGIVYFRERAALPAQEQYHSGLLKHDGTPDLGYREVSALAPERALMEAVAAHPPRARVALRYSYDDLWALQIAPHRKDFIYQRLIFVWYAALKHLGVDVDLVPPGAALDAYAVVIAPTAHLADAAEAAGLEAFARAGGAVIVGVRSGAKTTENAFTAQPLPGVLGGLVGANVSQWGALPDGVTFELTGELPGLAEPGAGFWVEALEPLPVADIRVLAAYAEGPWAGHSALTEHTLGQGRALYVGWYPRQAQAEAVLRRVLPMHNVPIETDLPPGLVLNRRGPYTMLLNFTDWPLSATVAGETFVVPGRDIVVRRMADARDDR
ncbi:MAG TPA: beta-galactosidase [Anaerolineales bacterium]|nr:beta-galactosidase [Anaerolineales bacterium]